MEQLKSNDSSNNPDEKIGGLLEIIAEVLNVSRCYIFEFCNKTDTMSNTFEWVQPGILPQIEKLQNIPISLISFWHNCMMQNEILNFTDVRDIPSFPENQVLIEQEIKSILIVPIQINDKYFGFIGIDECHYIRTWSELEIAFMKAMALFIRKLIEQKYK